MSPANKVVSLYWSRCNSRSSALFSGQLGAAAIYSSLWTQPEGGTQTWAKNVTQKLIASHWIEGRMKPGEKIDLWRTIS